MVVEERDCGGRDYEREDGEGVQPDVALGIDVGESAVGMSCQERARAFFGRGDGGLVGRRGGAVGIAAWERVRSELVEAEEDSAGWWWEGEEVGGDNRPNCSC